MRRARKRSQKNRKEEMLESRLYEPERSFPSAAAISSPSPSLPSLAHQQRAPPYARVPLASLGGMESLGGVMSPSRRSLSLFSTPDLMPQTLQRLELSPANRFNPSSGLFNGRSPLAFPLPSQASAGLGSRYASPSSLALPQRAMQALQSQQTPPQNPALMSPISTGTPISPPASGYRIPIASPIQARPNPNVFSMSPISSFDSRFSLPQLPSPVAQVNNRFPFPQNDVSMLSAPIAPQNQSNNILNMWSALKQMSPEEIQQNSASTLLTQSPIFSYNQRPLEAFESTIDIPSTSRRGRPRVEPAPPPRPNQSPNQVNDIEAQVMQAFHDAQQQQQQQHQ